jgi:hypothetical protein
MAEIWAANRSRNLLGKEIRVVGTWTQHSVDCWRNDFQDISFVDFHYKAKVRLINYMMQSFLDQLTVILLKKFVVFWRNFGIGEANVLYGTD